LRDHERYARGAAGAIAAFLAEQDIYKSAPSAQRDVAAVLTQSWWAQQLSANVATVSLGGSSRQFVRVADNSWMAPGPGYATMVQNGTRAPDNYLCPLPLAPQDPQYAQSRGWDEHAMSFDVTNPHGDVQHFGYFMFKYDTDSGIDCARQLGFQLQTWSFPQGPIVTLTYAQVQDQETLPPGELPGSTQELTQVANNMGQTINLDYGIYGSYLVGYQDGHGREVGVTGTGFTDTLGKLTSFSYLLPQATSATQRPVPFGLLSTVTTPEQPALAHTKYDYDSLGRVKLVWDAEALQVGDRLPRTFPCFCTGIPCFRPNFSLLISICRGSENPAFLGTKRNPGLVQAANFGIFPVFFPVIWGRRPETASPAPASTTTLRCAAAGGVSGNAIARRGDFTQFAQLRVAGHRLGIRGGRRPKRDGAQGTASGLCERTDIPVGQPPQTGRLPTPKRKRFPESGRRHC
jgi:hypothetical protein